MRLSRLIALLGLLSFVASSWAAGFVPLPARLGFPRFQFATPAPGGHIVYSRIIPGKVSVAGVGADLFISKLFVMTADGANPQPFIATTDIAQFKEAHWSPNYDRLVFTSDWLSSRSACMSDIFEARADGLVRRVTGQDVVGPAPIGYGSVVGRVKDIGSDGAIAERRGGEINVTAQGADGLIVHPSLGNNDFLIPKVAAGEQVWVKVWVTPHVGCLKLCKVRPGQVTDIGVLGTNEGTFAAYKPSISADGRYIVGMGGLMWTEMTQGIDAVIGQTAEGFTPGLHKKQEGVESICLYDGATGALLGSIDNGKLGYEQAKDPALSPDGRVIACAWGKPTQENLTLIDPASIAQGQPRPRVLVPGQLLAFQPGAPMVGCGGPAWSPDGRQIAFARTVMLGGGICSAGIWVVAPDGSGLREVAALGLEHICCQPCFSPDGRRIAFTVLTGKFGPIKVEQLIGRQFTLDLCAVDLQTKKMQQITHDGASCEPAWGP